MMFYPVIPQDLRVEASPTFVAVHAGTLTITSGSITDTSGAISFGDETINIGSWTAIGPDASPTTNTFLYCRGDTDTATASTYFFRAVVDANPSSSTSNLVQGVACNIRLNHDASSYPYNLGETTGLSMQISSNWASTGSLGSICILRGNMNANSSWQATVPNIYGLKLDDLDKTLLYDNASVPNIYGICVADVTADTNAYAIYTGKGLIRFGGGQIRSIAEITTNTNIDESYYTILINCSASAVTATLPASPREGQIYNLKCIDDTNTCTVGRNGKNIDGDASDIVLIEDESITVQYDGTEWWII